MLGALQVERIPLGHSLCGAWGCGPPSEALLAMHLFWLSAIMPPALLAIGYLNRTPKFWFWSGLVLLGITSAGLIGLLVNDLSTNKFYYEAGYGWQRYGLSLLSLVEVPILQTMLVGLTFVVTGRLASGTVSTPMLTPTPEVETTPAS